MSLYDRDYYRQALLDKERAARQTSAKRPWPIFRGERSRRTTYDGWKWLRILVMVLSLTFAAGLVLRRLL